MSAVPSWTSTSTDAGRPSALRADVPRADRARRSALPPKWFYDARGSELFEQITRLPEYYPTRAERAILAARADEIAAITGAQTLVELGSGSSEKTRLLLDALRAPGHAGHVRAAGRRRSARCARPTAAIAADYPGLAVHGVVGDFTRAPGPAARRWPPAGGVPRRHDRQPACRPSGPRSWPRCGPTCEPRRLAAARHRPGEGPGGAGRRPTTTRPGSPPSSTATCCACSTGSWAPTSTSTRSTTSRSGTRTRRVDRDAAAGPAADDVRVPALDLEVDFAAGEEMRTEISAKFRREGVDRGWPRRASRRGTGGPTTAGRFAVTLAQAWCPCPGKPPREVTRGMAAVTRPRTTAPEGNLHVDQAVAGRVSDPGRRRGAGGGRGAGTGQCHR